MSWATVLLVWWGDLAQHVLEGVVGGIDAQTAAGLDDGEEDGAASATFQGVLNSPASLRSRGAGANERCSGRPAATGKFRQLGAFRLREGDFTL